jgi:hypothetical protein
MLVNVQYQACRDIVAGFCVFDHAALSLMEAEF